MPKSSMTIDAPMAFFLSVAVVASVLARSSVSVISSSSRCDLRPDSSELWLPCPRYCRKQIAQATGSPPRLSAPARQPQQTPLPWLTKPRRCYTALHESRRNRRSDCQAAAGSTRPLPPLVHRIRGWPHRPRRGAQLHRYQAWPLRRPHFCRIEKAREGTVSRKNEEGVPAVCED